MIKFISLLSLYAPRTFPPPRRIQLVDIRAEEVAAVKKDIEVRAETLAHYIIENRTTVRDAAKKFGISKSTVHMVVMK